MYATLKKKETWALQLNVVGGVLVIDRALEWWRRTLRRHLVNARIAGQVVAALRAKYDKDTFAWVDFVEQVSAAGESASDVPKFLFVFLRDTGRMRAIPTDHPDPQHTSHVYVVCDPPPGRSQS